MPVTKIKAGTSVADSYTGDAAGIGINTTSGKLQYNYNGTKKTVPDVAGAITSTSATDGIGYATGAGGTVTQITSASTGVTLNKVCGRITTVALTTAAGAEEVFTVSNTAVAATDVVVVGTTYAGAGTPLVSVKKIAANAFDIVITNLHASDALNAVVVVNFAVIKSVTA